MKRTELSIGTASGALLSTLPFIQLTELFRTIVLAALGAIVSFLITLLLQKIRKK
ncbi:hypothetical protein H8S90_13895 [Olivibacter sp. SDN3]|uniref:hypothetical protein n=1 Tax=Olivibacter sp. SDN3 TaxID=2764720 RepID=UPI001651A10F|nr:hypothetical protein [Olivibacter sp. SDN3]QNL47911.1 hypothetical protein H8S90_13895 [Olivibacter sp. SDN3]